MSPGNRRLVVVSNRLPVVLEPTTEGWGLRSGSGGLVSALAPVLSHRGGLWIGWPGIPLEKGGGWEEVLAAGFRERGYDLAPVLLTEEEVKGFYEGFSNAVLWPLFHDQTGACDFEPAFWYSYLTVNRKFARAVVDQGRDDDFVWVQDYQLIHVAEGVRAEAPRRQIGFFLHIPFPPLDLFLKLPWRAQVLGALLAYDLLGFQTPRDRRNFLTCLEHLLPEVEILRDQPIASVRVGDRVVKVGAFPIGIDTRSFAETARSPEVEARMAELRRQIGPYQVVLGSTVSTTPRGSRSGSRRSATPSSVSRSCASRCSSSSSPCRAARGSPSTRRSKPGSTAWSARSTAPTRPPAGSPSTTTTGASPAATWSRSTGWPGSAS